MKAQELSFTDDLLGIKQRVQIIRKISPRAQAKLRGLGISEDLLLIESRLVKTRIKIPKVKARIKGLGLSEDLLLIESRFKGLGKQIKGVKKLPQRIKILQELAFKENFLGLGLKLEKIRGRVPGVRTRVRELSKPFEPNIKFKDISEQFLGTKVRIGDAIIIREGVKTRFPRRIRRLEELSSKFLESPELRIKKIKKITPRVRRKLERLGISDDILLIEDRFRQIGELAPKVRTKLPKRIKKLQELTLTEDFLGLEKQVKVLREGAPRRIRTLQELTLTEDFLGLGKQIKGIRGRVPGVRTRVRELSKPFELRIGRKKIKIRKQTLAEKFAGDDVIAFREGDVIGRELEFIKQARARRPTRPDVLTRLDIKPKPKPLTFDIDPKFISDFKLDVTGQRARFRSGAEKLELNPKTLEFEIKTIKPKPKPLTFDIDPKFISDLKLDVSGQRARFRSGAEALKFNSKTLEFEVKSIPSPITFQVEKGLKRVKLGERPDVLARLDIKPRPIKPKPKPKPKPIEFEFDLSNLRNEANLIRSGAKEIVFDTKTGKILLKDVIKPKPKPKPVTFEIDPKVISDLKLDVSGQRARFRSGAEKLEFNSKTLEFEVKTITKKTDLRKLTLKRLEKGLEPTEFKISKIKPKAKPTPRPDILDDFDLGVKGRSQQQLVQVFKEPELIPLQKVKVKPKTRQKFRTIEQEFLELETKTITQKLFPGFEDPVSRFKAPKGKISSFDELGKIGTLGEFEGRIPLQKQLQRDLLKDDLLLKTKQVKKAKSEDLILLAQPQEELVKQAQPQAQAFQQDLLSVQQFAQPQRQPERQAQRQRELTKTQQEQKQEAKIMRRILFPFLKIKGEAKPIIKPITRKEAYHVSIRPIRKKGQPKPPLRRITKRPTIESQALDTRDFLIDTSLARTGKIEKVNKAPQNPEFDIPVGYSQAAQRKFRNFKIVKGKRVPLPKNTVIELNTNLLDTPQEVKRIGLAKRLKQIRKPLLQKRSKRISNDLKIPSSLKGDILNIIS